MNASQKRRIEREDQERRNQRLIEEFTSIFDSRIIEVGSGDLPPDFVPNHNRKVRASRDFWSQSGRVVGVAPGTENDMGSGCTYRRRNLYDPSVNEVVNITSRRASTTTAAVETPQSDTLKYQHIIGTTKDYD